MTTSITGFPLRYRLSDVGTNADIKPLMHYQLAVGATQLLGAAAVAAAKR
jgi:hypothetical protein